MRIWERLKGEGTRAFAAFCVYRDLGPTRSMPKATARMGRKATYTRQLEKWSSRWNWVARAKAYDEHLERLKREASEGKVVEMAERHAELAEALLAKISHRVHALDPELISGRDLSALFKAGVEVERTSRGEPGSTSRVEATVDAESVGHLIGDQESSDLLSQLTARLIEKQKAARG